MEAERSGCSGFLLDFGNPEEPTNRMSDLRLPSRQSSLSILCTKPYRLVAIGACMLHVLLDLDENGEDAPMGIRSE